MMRKGGRFSSLLLVAFIGSIFLAQAQEVPTDVTPFVRLGHRVKVSIYQNPTMGPRGQQILDRGELLRWNMVDMPVGSGTIISEEGLILTNWHVHQIEPQVSFDRDRRLLRVAERAGTNMLVFRLADNDPLKVPVLQYQAAAISLDEEHDTALLRIVADKDGNPVDKNDFSYVPLGNPFGMRINEDMTVLGFPGKGGDTITITDGKFLGYYRDEYFPGLDGFIKTDAAMAPGNSGGAAMNKQELVGVPTAVTLPTQAGSDLGYIHPVTWALRGFAVARNKYSLNPPDIPMEWLTSEYNSDTTLDQIYVTGTVISAGSGKGVSGRVIVLRADRTLEEINRIHQEIEAVSIIVFIQQMRDYGLSVVEIAKRLQLPMEQVDKALSAQISEESISPDVRSYLEGVFFYDLGDSDEDGFFILSVPRGQKVVFHVRKDGFRPLEKSFAAGQAGFQSIGELKIFGY